jgi:N-acetylmuramoyl-L-alanine amidase
MAAAVGLGCSTTAGSGSPAPARSSAAPHAGPRPRATATPAQARGQTVVLDPGHDGGNGAHPEVINRQVPAGDGRRKPCNTTGTATDAGYPEHAFNWDVARRVRTILAGDGVRVVLTRSTDTGVGPCVDRRAAIGNRARAAAVVSIHGDGAATGHGFQVIQATGDPAGPRIAAASRRLAVDVHDRLRVHTGLTTATYIGRNGYSIRSDLGGLNLSVRPSVLVECGNMRDPGDARLMSSRTGRQRIAAALAAGIVAFLSG